MATSDTTELSSDAIEVLEPAARLLRDLRTSPRGLSTRRTVRTLVGADY
jgi:hypothetical protein